MSLVAIIALIMDFSTGKVSNKLILAGFLMGFVCTVLFGGENKIADDLSSVEYKAAGYLAGVVMPVVVLFPVFLTRGLGAGDIKLFAVIGGVIGWQEVLGCIILALVIGAALSIGKIIIHRTFFASFLNIAHYVAAVFQSKGGQFPVISREQCSTIHFTLPILISVLCYVGGMI
ncbi:A24 family peptidase [Konateibacter massiliensis]|uniref:A24 family peptidase n=1 Tax=Konateibacter massiliensis TaxID=2002841 RepID=UPI000C162524|nr:prepilin peptidase [Konateibacter massiliensis]